MKTQNVLTRISIWGNASIAVALAILLGIVPGVLTLWYVRDAAVHDGGIPDMAFTLHRTLTPAFAGWACDRVESGRGAGMSLKNISGTEWPPFGCAFYLWATESLQAEWERDPGRSSVAPKVYARDAIEAAVKLILDPSTAAWVRKHWGDDYLRKQDIFYRYLIIAATTAHYNLTADAHYTPLLREQVQSLSAEIEASHAGMLEDYPGECYPADVLSAIACIRRTDRVLGTDHSAFLARARRAFSGDALHPLGLPPYLAQYRSGWPVSDARGCSNSYICSVAPEVWPDAAAAWYAAYEKNFWQYRWGAFGFREFAKGSSESDWYGDVDAGPCIAGHGFAACAFGLSAARANGRFDHAYPLTAELAAISWPMLNGRMLLPQILSNATDAPLLGEAAILYNLTRMPPAGVPVVKGGKLPALVYVMVCAYSVTGTLLLWGTLRAARMKLTRDAYGARLQFGIWALLLGGGMLGLWMGYTAAAIVMILLAQFLPRTRRPAAEATV